MQSAQQRQKRYYDAKHTVASFEVGDSVLLSTANLNLETNGTRKLWPRWCGPVTVLAKLGTYFAEATAVLFRDTVFRSHGMLLTIEVLSSQTSLQLHS